MKRLLTSALLATGTLFAAYLVEKRQSPWAFAQETNLKFRVKLDQYQTLTKQAQNFEKALTALQNTLTQARPTVVAIRQDVVRFQFKMAPRVTTMGQTLANLKTMIEKG